MGFQLLLCPCPDMFRDRLPVTKSLQGDTFEQKELPDKGEYVIMRSPTKISFTYSSAPQSSTKIGYECLSYRLKSSGIPMRLHETFTTTR